MRARAFSGACLATVLGTCGLLRAQVSHRDTGTVTGLVTCGDTQRPARFARVTLFEVPSSLAPQQISSSTGAISAQLQEAASRTMVQTQTGIDGSFVVEDLPQGDYYVMASAAGYVQPRYLLEAAYDAGEDVLRGVTGVPVIRVSAGRATEVAVSVNRGAAIEGHLLWDDGTPVSGAYVQAQPTAKGHKNLPQQFSMINSSLGPNGFLAYADDRGRYRISGLAPGEYRVTATLPTGSSRTVIKGTSASSFSTGGNSMPLVVYAPDVFRQKDAKLVKLSAGEEHDDEDITVNIGGTHSVSGRVTSAEDHHAVGWGQVQLRDETDTTFFRGASVDEDGNFSVAFVPPGTYSLHVWGADAAPGSDQTNPGMVQKIVRAYQGAKQQVIVTDNDVAGQNVELNPMKVQPDHAGEGEQEHEVIGTGH